MNHLPDYDPRRSTPWIQARRVRDETLVEKVARRWRLLGPAVLVVAALIMTFFPQSQPGNAQNASVAGVSRSPAAQPSPTKGSAIATTALTPTPVKPTSTPAPYRPLAQPTMPPDGSVGVAPVRKPEATDPDPHTDHFVVMDGPSGSILFQKNGDQRIAPASLTKIMTAILGIEYGNLTDHPKIDVDARQMVESTLMGLEPGFDVSVEDLLYGLMLPSGNDAALAIARYVAGSDAAFVKMMNDKAASLGLKNTHFANPHGLDDLDHYSSPNDMAAMARYGMKYPLFREIVSTKRWDIRGSNISYSLHNVNPFLNAYPGADGVKTGFTDNAGRAIVASATRNGHRVYVALMRSGAGAAVDAATLMDWAFGSFEWR